MLVGMQGFFAIRFENSERPWKLDLKLSSSEFVGVRRGSSGFVGVCRGLSGLGLVGNSYVKIWWKQGPNGLFSRKTTSIQAWFRQKNAKPHANPPYFHAEILHKLPDPSFSRASLSEFVGVRRSSVFQQSVRTEFVRSSSERCSQLFFRPTSMFPMIFLKMCWWLEAACGENKEISSKTRPALDKVSLGWYFYNSSPKHIELEVIKQIRLSRGPKPLGSIIPSRETIVGPLKALYTKPKAMRYWQNPV